MYNVSRETDRHEKLLQVDGTDGTESKALEDLNNVIVKIGDWFMDDGFAQ